MRRNLRELLEFAYRDFHSVYHRNMDPISFAHKYEDNSDKEVVAFISSLLSYGNVKAILKSLNYVFGVLNPSPYTAILKRKFLGKLEGFSHRFTKGEDLEIVFFWLSQILEKYNSIESFFFNENNGNFSTKSLIIQFVNKFISFPLEKKLLNSFKKRSCQILYLLPSPQKGSACKRMNLFLRWVCRKKDSIDLGLWTKLSPSMLMLPVDVHIMRTLRLLKLTKAKSPSWKVVEDATGFLRKLDPNDPIKFDFALCHLSMNGENLYIYEKMERRILF